MPTAIRVIDRIRDQSDFEGTLLDEAAVRYTSGTDKFSAGQADVFNEVPTGAINGVNDTFTLANTPLAGSTRVYKNGLRQLLTTHYVESSNTVVLSDPPSTGDELTIDYRTA